MLYRIKGQQVFDFNRFREVNWRRANDVFGDREPWSLLERCGEMAGEAGEAANIAKKIKRGCKMVDGQVVPYSKEDLEELYRKLADELADVIVTVDLVASEAGIDLGAAVVKKFNEKSEEWGCDHKL